ncbi:MAG TPA: hypothetical protein ENF69_06925 [Euryarchaeota archaeon]|nr:hypothetical protein [Euryarchaeota archaeon]
MSGHSEIQLRFPISNANEKTSFPFVEWANGEDSDYPEGQHVEAVFCGHTHENHIFYDVETDGMDSPPDYSNEKDPNYVSPFVLISLEMARGTFYIETDTACKEG